MNSGVAWCEECNWSVPVEAADRLGREHHAATGHTWRVRGYDLHRIRGERDEERMTTEQDRVMAWLTERWGTVAALAESLVSAGFSVPEPQWRPGQYAWVTYKGERLFVRRTSGVRRWEVLNDDGSDLTDDEVADVEPVAVLTAEDARALRERRYLPAFEEFFAERGVDVR